MARDSEQHVLTLTTSGKGTSLVRIDEIERRKGEPPTEAELRDLVAFRRHPVVRQMQAGRKKVIAAKRISENASPRDRRRLWDMNVGDIYAEARARARPSPGSVRRPRERSFRRRRSSSARGDPDPEPPSDLEVVPLARLRWAARRWPEGVA
jgi:hypothetical protein